jgi:hypothetical protein
MVSTRTKQLVLDLLKAELALTKNEMNHRGGHVVGKLNALDVAIQEITQLKVDPELT